MFGYGTFAELTFGQGPEDGGGTPIVAVVTPPYLGGSAHGHDWVRARQKADRAVERAEKQRAEALRHHVAESLDRQQQAAQNAESAALLVLLAG